MFFIGIDLAWSEKNSSGVAILEGSRDKAEFVSANICKSDEDIIEYIVKTIGEEGGFIAIDAPLIVPNEDGRRIAEKLVGFLFRKYDAGAHPTNRRRLSQWSGKIRGEEIATKLKKVGFVHSPHIKKFEKTRKFFEVFPHPSMVVIFNLDKILKYKAKPKRDYEFRWNEFKKYQIFLKSLKGKNPSLSLPEEITEKNVKKLRAHALKAYEDILDAIFCAYIAYYCWFNPENCAALGSMKEGYILTPIFSFMKDQLKKLNSQKRLMDFNYF